MTGVMIEQQHCCIENHRGVLTLTARAETYVNGQLVSSETRLYHGDRVIIGGTHYFHLHHPTGVHPDRKHNEATRVTLLVPHTIVFTNALNFMFYTDYRF